MTILVTGGAGFIGSNFIRYMFQTYPDIAIINLDALTYAGNPDNLTGLSGRYRYTFCHGDITDGKTVDGILEQGVDAVVNFAAESHVDRSITDPGIFVRTNVLGTQVLLDGARKFGLRKYLQVSTDEVYGTLGKEGYFTEETPLSPNSPYSASKAGADMLVRAYHETFGMNVNITRCSNNFGPRQFPEKLIPLMVLNALNVKPLPVYGDGMQIRDWLYVDDHCEAIIRVVKNGRDGETYCVGGDNQPPNIEIVKTICEILDELQPESAHCPHQNLISYVADRPGHDRRYDIDISKIENELGWKPSHDLRQGLVDTVKWYLDNPEWIQAIVQQSDYDSWVQTNYTGRKA